MKKRFMKLQKRQEDILKSKDPLTIARHLVTVLNDQGYSTRSYGHIDDMHSINFYMHKGIESPLVVENLAQGWRLEENK